MSVYRLISLALMRRKYVEQLEQVDELIPMLKAERLESDLKTAERLRAQIIREMERLDKQINRLTIRA